MSRPYQVVLSVDEDFFLYKKEVYDLAELNQEWAVDFINSSFKNLSEGEKIVPSSKDLPRHSKQLISIAKKIDRLDVVDLEVRFWPPKYKVVMLKGEKGESVLEPCTVNWDTVYYPEAYNIGREMTDEEINDRRIKAIAP